MFRLILDLFNFCYNAVFGCGTFCVALRMMFDLVAGFERLILVCLLFGFVFAGWDFGFVVYGCGLCLLYFWWCVRDGMAIMIGGF